MLLKDVELVYFFQNDAVSSQYRLRNTIVVPVNLNYLALLLLDLLLQLVSFFFVPFEGF